MGRDVMSGIAKTLLLVQVTVVSVVVRSFRRQEKKQTEIGQEMGWLSKKNKCTKTRDAPEVTSFDTNLSLRGHLQRAWPKREI